MVEIKREEGRVKFLMLTRGGQYQKEVVDRFAFWSRDAIRIDSCEIQGVLEIEDYFDKGWKYRGADSDGVEPVFKHYEKVNRVASRDTATATGTMKDLVDNATRCMHPMVKNGMLFAAGVMLLYLVLTIIAVVIAGILSL